MSEKNLSTKTKREFDICVIRGDGIGAEVVNSSLIVLNEIANKFDLKFNLKDALLGGIAYDECKTPLPQETIDLAKNSDSVLFGAIGGAKWDSIERHLRPESGLLAFRKELDLYANLRPAKVYDELVDMSSLKSEVVKGVDIMIVRELTGGIYFGQPRDKQDDMAYNTMVYSKNEIERIAKIAIDVAKKRYGNNENNAAKICSVDKANVLEVSQLWREVVDKECQKDVKAKKIELSHMYVDNCAMQLVANPKQFEVILTSNLFGDILSDEASMICGSIGMLPSASIGSKYALYEPIHGSAPDIAGRDIANPIATIASISMMFRYSLNLHKEADCIDEAIAKTLKNGFFSMDLAKFSKHKPLGCKAMGEKIASFI